MASQPMFWRPEQLGQWQRWQRAQWPASRRAVDAARSAVRTVRSGGEVPETTLWLSRPAGAIHTVVALESFGPTQLASMAAPIAAWAEGASALDGVAWLLPSPTPPALPGTAGHAVELVGPHTADALRPTLRQVLVAGEYLPSGRTAVRWARESAARVKVVQHGLLALSTPPVPHDCVLFAFSAADADWWTQGRTDVETVDAGSALLWQASQKEDGAAPARHDGPGVFLGQLHGAELPRSEFAAAAEQYVRATGATYRPHPAEKDRLSRAQHEKWRADGFAVDGTGALTQTAGPVAAVFSTGVLEAAQTGRPAYVVHPDPPAWLLDFWARYGMSRWTPERTPDPTPAFAMPHGDPAEIIARHLREEIGA